MTLNGALRLPDGTPVRSRGLRRPLPASPLPDFSLYVLSRLRRCPTSGCPPTLLRRATAIRGLYDRAAAGADVEVACGGEVGRAGP
ncbi:hypothetical protein [Herbidospora mongoliensis]|uniref:hypothetical protein n=1 Tax=Herbidospora mongoliensis TaxID=688067 RepID=UPI000833C18B|nr:hypothetical protein [Herbidospora mongoliensis]